jgi:transposase-like protein
MHNSDSSEFETTRRAYSRECKISVLDWHQKNDSNESETSRHFDIPQQNISRWVRDEVAIRNAKEGAKHLGGGRSVAVLPLEHRLDSERSHDKGSKGSNTFRRAYSREFKLSVLSWHKNNGSIAQKTSHHFNIFAPEYHPVDQR